MQLSSPPACGPSCVYMGHRLINDRSLQRAHTRTCRHIEVVWLHRGSMLEARPSSGAVQLPACANAARPRCEAWLLLSNLCPSLSLRMAFRGAEDSIRVAPCSMHKCKLQINYPPHHRDRFVPFFSPACMHASTCFPLGRVSEGLPPPHNHHRSSHGSSCRLQQDPSPRSSLRIGHPLFLFPLRRPIAV